MNGGRLWIALAFLLPALAATIAPMSAFDLAYQVRTGELMLVAGEVVRADPFTFTAFGDPWLNQQWGAAGLFAVVHEAGGWGGLVVLKAVLVALAIGLVVVGARRWLPARSASLLALAGFVVALPSLGLRAQLIGVLLFAAVVAILAWRDRRPWLMVLVPFLVVAWANTHGSFFLGPAAVAVALLDDVVARRAGLAARLADVTSIGAAPSAGPSPAEGPDAPGAPPGIPSRRRLAWLGIVLVLSLAATVITPFGPAVWTYALGIATNGEIARLITEWQRTLPFTVTGALFYASVAAAGAALWLARSRGALPRWPVLAWLAGLALLGVYAERGVAWWAIAAPVALAPVVAILLAAAEVVLGPAEDEDAAPRVPDEAAAAAARARTLRRLDAVLVVGLVVAIVALQPIWRGGDPLTGPPGLLSDAPGGLAVALAEAAGPDDRAVVTQRWASWFEWAAPGVPVMVDSRVEVVPVSAWEDYFAIVAGGEGALETLQRIGATVVVVDPATQSALNVALRTAGSGWRLSYDDDQGLLFTPAE